MAPSGQHWATHRTMGFTSPAAALAKMTSLAPMEVPTLPLAAMAAAQTGQDVPLYSRESTPPPVAVAVAPATASGPPPPLSSIREAESLVDLSAMLIDKTRMGGSPVPPLAESDVASVSSTRTSITSSYRGESFYSDDDDDDTESASTTSTAASSPSRYAKRPLLVRTASRSPSPPLSVASRFPAAPPRLPLQWEFSGLTLWIELEEFSNDLSNCITYMTHRYGIEHIPQSHMTAIYGMSHLSNEEAGRLLRTRVKGALPGGRWPKFRPPIGIVQDVAVAGNPGQVCSIAWAQLTLASGPDHELALDALYDVFYGSESAQKTERHRPWTPHNSFAYDNPEETVLTTACAFEAVAQYPTLLTEERNVAAISLWDTNGKMGDWKCLERLSF